MAKPLVSIIILTYKDGLESTKNCLESLTHLTHKSYEIILVDNASSDNTVAFVKKHYPQIKLIKNKRNLGFCRGNNQAIRVASGKYILFLNNDTMVTPHFLSLLVDELEGDKKLGVVQPKIRQLIDKGRLDACASYLTNTGFLYHYGYSQNQEEKKYNRELLMYSAKGACFLTRKNLIDKIGLFDGDFFAYFEETDFCHRVWLSGYTVKYVPHAEIFHLGGVGKDVSSPILFHSYKNRMATYIKNLGLPALFKILPLHVLFCFAIIILYFLLGKFPYSIAIIKSLLWNCIHGKETLMKRRLIQSKIRVVRDEDFLKTIQKRVALSYYKHFLLNPRGHYDFEKA